MKLVLQLLLPPIIIAGAYLGGKKMIESKEAPKSKQPKMVTPLAETLVVSPKKHQVSIRTFGTVQSRDTAQLTPQVNARILSVSDAFRVGNTIKQGEILVTLERTNLEAALADQTSSLADIKRQLEEETVRSKQASQDWIASGRKLTTASDFRLRKPQLDALRARLESVESNIKKATADLTRTEIKAPFDSLVAERSANLGEFATTQRTLGSLFSTKKAEIRFSLTPSQLRQLQKNTKLNKLIEKGAKVTITMPHRDGIERQATFARIEPQIDPRNQTVYAIAEINNPFDPQKGRLGIGSYVNAELAGPVFENCYKLPESALVQDKFIWIVVDKKLMKAKATRLFNQDGYVFCHITPSLQNVEVVTRPLVSYQSGTEIDTKQLNPQKN